MSSTQHAGSPQGDAPLGVAVIGAGYWGPNLVRNFRGSANWDLVGVCDLNADRARKVIGNRSTVEVFTDLAQVLDRDDVHAVAIATPAATHAPIALAALAAGKHVVVEKPLADTPEAATAMVQAAEQADRMLMIDHTYCYTPAVQHIRKVIADGVLGDILYIDSVRINLGLIQPDVDVFWDLAPHDLSILDFVLPGGLRPESVAASRCLASLAWVVRSTPRSKIDTRCCGFRSSQTRVRRLPPITICRIFVGDSQFTLTWAIAPPGSGMLR